MSKTIQLFTAILTALLLIAGAFFWFEAEKEVRILCSMFSEGTSESDLVRMLNTGNLLHYEIMDQDEPFVYFINSSYTLGTSTCIVRLTESGTVEAASYRRSINLHKVAAFLAALLLGALALFHFLLMIGKPYGKWAWGGFHEVLPVWLRSASGISFLMFIFATVIYVSYSGVLNIYGTETDTHWFAWAFFILFSISSVMNGISPNPNERRVMLPLSLTLTYLSLLVAMGG